MATDEHTAFVPAGHFYSPYTNDEDTVRASATARAEMDGPLPGLALDDGAMVDVWAELVPHMAQLDLPETAENTKGTGAYHYLNDMYSYGDADIYAGMIGRHRPKRIIEIGSGYSSALAVETRDILGLGTQITFIEPYPDRLKLVWGTHDWTGVDLIEKPVQDVALSLFSDLQANDIVFVDSSHVVKSGSDVCHEVFRILPCLAPGVVVHFHDCFWPLEYPDQWVVQDRRNWTELYLLRAFLMYNDTFQITFMNQYFAHRHANRAAQEHPRFMRNPGGGLWLQRNS